MTHHLLPDLQQGLQALSCDLDVQQAEQLLAFIDLLTKWNKVYNLTSIRTAQDMLTLHILDSLVLLPLLHGQNISRLLDVGTGGGLPGIPLAIVLRDKEFVLVDARAKKIRFLQTVIAQLGLQNVQVKHIRVEHYQRADKEKFDRILSRAFSSLQDMLLLTQHLCSRQGKFLAMKGQWPQQEIDDMPDPFVLEQSHALTVPGLAAERHALEIVFRNHERG